MALDTKDLKKEYSYLYGEAESLGAAGERFYELIKVLRRLCPWDRAQTHRSLRKCMLEEAYEACEAIDRADFGNLREELGDVMLQVVMHSELAEEEGHFDLLDVINGECDKMIRRHPHIFSGSEAKTVDKVLEKWENVKSKEHGDTTHTQRLSEVPKALPALTRSAKVQKRAGETGFEFEDIEGALAKVSEELEEFVQAREEADDAGVREELGDLLFSVVNVSRFAGLDPEECLNSATEKFIKRFGRLEQSAADAGRRLENMTAVELDELWKNSK